VIELHLGIGDNMSWYDSLYDNTLGKIIPSSNPMQDTSDVRNIGAGQPTNANGGVNMGQLNLPYFQQDRDRLQGLMDNKSPYASSDWQGLIAQLSARANGTGPSLAQQNYNMASGDTTNALSSMARGSSNPEAARQAMIQQGRIGQGQAAGLALAGTQEQQAAQQGLTSALGTRDQLNQSAYLNILGQQLGLSMGQLKALNGDQQFIQGQNQINQQNNANKYQALASIFGSMAGMGQSAGKAAMGA
jgi:hypothetical protein